MIDSPLSGVVKPKRFTLTRPVELIDIGPILVEPVTCVRRAWDLLSGSEAGRVETSPRVDARSCR